MLCLRDPIEPLSTIKSLPAESGDHVVEIHGLDQGSSMSRNAAMDTSLPRIDGQKVFGEFFEQFLNSISNYLHIPWATYSCSTMFPCGRPHVWIWSMHQIHPLPELNCYTKAICIP